MPADLQERRLALGDAAVFSLSVAAELLPVSDGEARRWLRARGLVRALLGREVVIWGDVLDALREDTPNDASPAAGRSRRTVKVPVERIH